METIALIQDNWLVISGAIVAAMPLIEYIVSLTPTKKDDKFLGITKKFLKAIGVKSNKKGGGKHE